MITRITILTATVLLLGLSTPGYLWAIPNQHLNPHSDAPADISWPNPAPADPETANHFHLKLRAGETLAQGASSVASNMGWQADSVWDDRFYRFADANNDVINDLVTRFGHGYIDPTFQPRYTFNNVPAAAQPLLNNTFTTWNAAAQVAATAVGAQTPAGTPTKTSIAFQNVAAGNPAEFQIQFSNNVLSTQNAFAEWIVSAAQDNPGGPALAPLTMIYESNPTNGIVFDNDNNPSNVNTSTWQFRVKDTDPGTAGNQPGAWMGSYSQAVGWHFGAGAPPAIATFDYEYRDSTVPANVFDELPAGSDTLFTSTFGQWSDTGGAADADFISFTAMDFQTIALHETGHILGLLHDPTSAAGAAGNIMRTQIAFNASFGNTLRNVDGNSAHGAAMLYSIPIPEPSTYVLAAMGLVGLGIFARRRRR